MIIKENRRTIAGFSPVGFRCFRKIGVTGFEPATSRPPAARSNQAEPYPDNGSIIIYL